MTQQPARFLFKLRRNIALEGDLQLARMELEAFLPRGVEDVADLASAAPDFVAHTTPDILGAPNSHVRAEGVQGFSARATLAALPELIRCLSFVQRIYCSTARSEPARALLASIENELGQVIAVENDEDHLLIQAVPHYALIELSDVVVRQSASAQATEQNLQRVLDVLLGRTTDRRAARLAERALAAHSTTAHFSHDVHYYKAKFFPRLARGMLNLMVQRLGGEYQSLHVVDNFAGSGTALLEATALGLPSTGLDIDPLSVFIARTKLQTLSFDSELLAAEHDKAAQALEGFLSGQGSLFEPALTPNAASMAFPSWLLKNRKLTPALADDLCREISAIQAVVSKSVPEVQGLLRVLMSDAIARKIRMRFLGTGVGRFSLTFAKAPIATLFLRSSARYVKVIAAAHWLQRTLQLDLAKSEIIKADTRDLAPESGPFDLLLTSPPYLPASSGRESYAKGRAPSLIALGMSNVTDVDNLIDDSIGSMDDNGYSREALTPTERKTVEWLQGDELRRIKAAPTARYFLDLRQTFSEMQRVLRPGALAVVVSGKQSTFYKFSTREALHVVPAAEILADEASRAGFEVEALHDVMLNKSNRNARPRSLDDYYETLIMLRRP